jgi:hypothetical protein
VFVKRKKRIEFEKKKKKKMEKKRRMCDKE